MGDIIKHKFSICTISAVIWLNFSFITKLHYFKHLKTEWNLRMYKASVRTSQRTSRASIKHPKFLICVAVYWLPDFLSSSGSGKGSTQPREVNWGATWIKKVAAPVQKTAINGRGDALRWPRDTPLSAKVGTNFADRRRPLCRYSSRAD